LTFDSNFSSPSCFMIIGLILFLHCILNTYQKTIGLYR
jgi:hypothetical protein